MVHMPNLESWEWGLKIFHGAPTLTTTALEMVSERVVTSSASTYHLWGKREGALNMQCYNQRHDAVLVVKMDFVRSNIPQSYEVSQILSLIPFHPTLLHQVNDLIWWCGTR